MNANGSPWAVRWFPVAEARLYTAARLSTDTLNFLNQIQQAKNLNENTNSAITIVKKQQQKGDPDLAVHLATIGFVGLLGLAIGRLSHQQ